jgi:NADP-dependent 3-hydroxy acid dehydrogenase YdfG
MPERVNPVAVVTGAASGIGAATARPPATDGMAVGVLDVAEAVKRVAVELGPLACW